MALSEKFASSGSAWGRIKKVVGVVFKVAKYAMPVVSVFSFGTQLYDRLSDKTVQVSEPDSDAKTETTSTSSDRANVVPDLNLEQPSASSDDLSL